MGRPDLYDAEVAAAILECLADGMLLAEICQFPGFPKESTVRGWAVDDREGFAAPYTRARRIGWEKRAEELLIISDTPEPGETVTASAKDGITVKRGDMLEHRRLRVDTRKWLLAKMIPKVYGDRMTHAGDSENPVTHAFAQLKPSTLPITHDDNADSA